MPAFPRPFLSLKWQVLVLTSLLLLLFSFGYYHFTIDRAAQNYREQVELERGQLARQLSVLVSGEHELLRLLESTVSSREGMAVAFGADSLRDVAQAFSSQWPRFQSESGVSLAQLYTGDGVLLGSWGSPMDASSVVTRVLTRNRAQDALVCEDACFIVSGMAVESGGKRLVLVLAFDLVRVLEEFESINDLSVALLLPEPEDGEPTLWGQQVAYVSSGGRTLPVLQAASRQLPLDALDEHPGRWQTDLAVYSLSTIPLPSLEVGAARLLTMSDATADDNRNTAYLNDVLRITVLSSVVMVTLLFFWLWWPTSRLRVIAGALPLLAQHRFEEASRQMMTSLPPFFRDESDVVKEASLSLASQLESLQDLLDKRASQLERRSRELERERNFAMGLLNSAHAVVLTQNSAGEIMMINQHGAAFLGQPQELLVGSAFAKLLPPDVVDGVCEELARLSACDEGEYQHECMLESPGKGARCLLWFHSRLSKLDGAGASLLSVGLDISERKSAEASLGWLASHDALTRLLNRHRFEEELEQLLAGARSHGHKGAVLLIDLDHFKDINDSSGHAAGDEMLRKVGQVLEETACEDELVARLGPDEFGVLIPGVDVMSAGEGADRFTKALMRVAVAGHQRVHRITASIGVALYPMHGSSSSELLCNADMALLEAKQSGRNAWRIYAQDDAGRERISERVFWNERVRTIVNERAFDLHFQPIARLATGDISHYEALVRVHNERGQLESPAKFIAAAERTGMIRRLDEVVIERVMACQAALLDRGLNVTIAVNLSAQSFHNPMLVEHIDHCIEHYGADPRAILFEITETAAVEDIGAAWEIMTTLRRRGFRFALDDFGVGYCSLQYLKRLPVDYLKIDGSFIRSLHENPDDRVVVKGVIEIARAFGLRTIAEFVDSQEVKEHLALLGVDYVQGYHIDVPRTFVELWGVHATADASG